MRLNEPLQRLGMLLVPAAMLLGDGPRIVIGMKVQGVDEIAVRLGIAGIQGDRLAIGGDGLVELSAFPLNALPRLLKRFGKTGSSRDGTLIGRDRLVELPRVVQRIAEIAVSWRIVGPKGDGLLISGDGRSELADLPQHIGEIGPCLGKARPQASACR